MKAVLVEEGAPLKLGDFEKPNLKPGEVLVKVAASGLNRADLVQRRGAYPPPPGASPIMGLEISGTVVETSDGTSRFNTGDRVAGVAMPSLRRSTKARFSPFQTAWTW